VNILYDHQVFSLQDAGGASRYYFELLKCFANIPNIEVQTLIGFNSSVMPLASVTSSSIRVRSIRSSIPPGVLRYAANEALSIACKTFSGRFDIYHSTLYRFIPTVTARRRFATHHDCVHERFPQLFRDVKRILRAKRKLFEKADGIICVSESSRRDLEEFYGIARDRTRVIHHGFSPLPCCASAEEQLRTATRREYILFVGSRAAYKNFPTLLRAFRATEVFKSYDLVTVGGGPFTEAEQTLFRELEVEEAVVGIPKASDALLSAAYGGATLFVYPSLYEGFGFPPLEAMSRDCPVLVTRSSSLPEICMDAALYFEQGCEESLSRELLRSLSDTEAREAAINRGKEIVKLYSWRRCAEQTLDYYRECLRN
jgi:glycosyltransferase involved in cell wall biosynthesis